MVTCQTHPPASVFTWTLNGSIIASNKKDGGEGSGGDGGVNDGVSGNIFGEDSVKGRKKSSGGGGGDNYGFQNDMNNKHIKRGKRKNKKNKKKQSGFVLEDGGSVLKIGPFNTKIHQGSYRCVAFVEGGGSLGSSFGGTGVDGQVGSGIIISSEALVEGAGT